ncbi:MAG: PASTA domain-containing protein [Spirochaetes bacterium]|nr:PASTA domain-containing protein [Spirochaetota bacterium]
MSLLKIDPKSTEDYVSNHFKFFLLSLFGVLAIVGIIAVSIFFVIVRGAEQTLVPDVMGRELTEALIELQDKGLYPMIQLRYSQTAGDRGLIVEQEPAAGTIVRAGRRVRLVVSQGVLISSVDNFIGLNFNEVAQSLQGPVAAGLPAISVREPVMFDFSTAPAGTVLQQNPQPGAGITGDLYMEFVVSRGPFNALVTVPQLTGLNPAQALSAIDGLGVNFEFNLRQRAAHEAGETVVAQSPPPNASVPYGSTVQLVISSPASMASGEVFNTFRFTAPRNPYPLAMSLEAVLPSGERVSVANVEHHGGVISVPYRLPLGSILILSMQNRELHREMVVSQQSFL